MIYDKRFFFTREIPAILIVLFVTIFAFVTKIQAITIRRTGFFFYNDKNSTARSRLIAVRTRDVINAIFYDTVVL